MKQILSIFLVASFFFARGQQKSAAIDLQDISWTTAQQVLTPDVVVVIPLGAGAKEHGPHLPLSTDYIQAEGVKKLLSAEKNIVFTPTVNYGFYPAFLQYAGSTSLNYATSTDMVLEVVRSLAAYGPKRFYIINIGVSTTPTLATAAKILAGEGILLFYSDYSRPGFARAEEQFAQQAFGGHADEIETSNVLYLRGDLVDMRKAVDDSSVKGKSGMPMTPIAMEGGILVPSGINGYATLGTKQKGKLSMTAFTAAAKREIDSIRSCALPVVATHAEEFTVFEGTYLDSSGKKLVISQNNNVLYCIWDGRDRRKFFPLHKDAEDYFSSVPITILFVRDASGKVMRAWCRIMGEYKWLLKSS